MRKNIHIDILLNHLEDEKSKTIVLNIKDSSVYFQSASFMQMFKNNPPNTIKKNNQILKEMLQTKELKHLFEAKVIFVYAFQFRLSLNP